ncbi:DNA polymerase III subunit chi [Govanella unica]|uniref:DNA polymerase III subunit chi n=1 Tax=Govanella unica TaxID=2975056 RepID=A0A9X3Z7U3_9PROT|nr:DNA polymerase III subunit chi [Govania unica]MDA5194359.1 DNA polymerase III subunit chi [Govania unica]
MTDVSFYHLMRQPLSEALPRLLEKALERGMRAVVLASPDRLESLDAALWTYEDASFLPHGTRKTGHADLQPVYLTDQEENPNSATLLVVVDGQTPEFLGSFDRCLDMFDGANDPSVQSARERWKLYKAAGHNLTYWQQRQDGGWDKKA